MNGLPKLDFNRELINPFVLQALWETESSMQAKAVGTKGERGIGQVRRLAWIDAQDYYPELKEYEYDKWSFDPEVNKFFSEAYLNTIYNKYLPKNKKAIEHVLAAYNTGPTAYGKKYNYDWERSPSANYVRKILRRAQELQQIAE
jgi:hypothetical protein